MPGALTAPSIFPDLGALWRQSRHPVWNANGRQVGSYETLDALCQGQWLVFTGEAQPPPSQLYVHDFWGRRVPLSTQCVRAAKATAKAGGAGVVARILQPQPVTAASAVKAAAAASAGTPPLPPIFDLDALSGPLPDAYNRAGTDAAGRTQLGTYALWGGLALLGVVVLATGRR